PSLICPRTAPTATVAPSLAAISLSTPAAGAGTSIVTLSVSSSTSGSSTATASPGCLNHLPMVASVTDSPRVGAAMAGMIGIRKLVDRGQSDSVPLKPPPSSAFQRVGYLLAERLVHEHLELREVFRHDTDCRRCRGRTAGVDRPLVFGAELIEHPFEIGL